MPQSYMNKAKRKKEESAAGPVPPLPPHPHPPGSNREQGGRRRLQRERNRKWKCLRRERLVPLPRLQRKPEMFAANDQRPGKSNDGAR